MRNQISPPLIPTSVAILGILFLSLFSWAQDDMDPPDQKLEARIHRIYEHIEQQGRMSDEKIAALAKDKNTEKYLLQPGDTLWDVSVTLFGNGYFWPKVWQLNSDITNPHQIKPGKNLSFFPGSAVEGPTVKLEESSEESTMTKQVVKNLEEAYGDQTIDLPPSEEDQKPTLMQIPPSFPPLSGVESIGRFNSAGFAIEDASPRPRSSAVALTSFVSVEVPAEEGKLIAFDSEARTGILWDKVFVKMNRPTKPGATFVIFKEGSGLDAKGGYPIYDKGELTIVSLMNSENSVYEARVSRSISQIFVADRLRSGHITKFDLAPRGPVNDKVSAQIIGGEYQEDRKTFGINSVIYLNRGSADGLNVGEILEVFKSTLARKDGVPQLGQKLKVAKVKIVKITGYRATGVIVALSDLVYLGDFVGVVPREFTAGVSSTVFNSDRPDFQDEPGSEQISKSMNSNDETEPPARSEESIGEIEDPM